MFDQLDDPEGFTPSDSFRGAVRRRTQQLVRRRRAGRVALVGALPVLGLAAVAVGLDRRLDSVQRVEIGNDGTDPLDTGAPVTLLVLGTDAAPNDPQRVQMTTTDSDVIVVVRIDPASRTVSTLSIPRYVWTGDGKINSLGPAELTAWLADHLDIHVDHLVSMDMEGFGGSPTGSSPEFASTCRSATAAPGWTSTPGARRSTATQALAYVRARHLQDLPGDPNSWRNDPTGDIGRIVRTQSLVQAGWSQLGRLDPTDLPAVVDVLADTAVLDADLTTERLLPPGSHGPRCGRTAGHSDLAGPPVEDAGRGERAGAGRGRGQPDAARLGRPRARARLLTPCRPVPGRGHRPFCVVDPDAGVRIHATERARRCQTADSPPVIRSMISADGSSEPLMPARYSAAL